MKPLQGKRLTALLLALAITLSLSACGTAPAETAEEPAAITLTDQAGRTVTLDAPAQSIVSCYYITTYATIALGVSDRVAGLEKKAETRPIYHLAAPYLLEKEQVGTMKECSVEAIAALSPDLVLMPKKLLDYADTLAELGIPVLVVAPEDMESMEEMLTLIAAACGVEDRAEQLLDYYDTKLAEIEQCTSDENRPSVCMAGNSSYLEVAPDGMYQGSLIQLAGGENAAKELSGDYWVDVSYESLLAMAPEVFLIPVGADYTAEDVKNDPQLAALPAVQNNAVYAMPTGFEEWDSPVPSGILGALWMTSILHPEVYSQKDFIGDAEDFYETFYGVSLTISLS